MVETGDPRVLLSIDGALASITLARPEKLNALDKAMTLALERAAHIIDASDTVRVAIMTGEGERAFCAGGDIGAWSNATAEEFGMQWIRIGHRAFDALARLRQPLIAALNGSAMGGGLELATTADFRIAEAHAKISLPETGLGIIPGWSGTQRAVQRYGQQVVRRLALGGETFTADQALAVGLVDQVVPQGESLKAAHAMAQKLMARAGYASSMVKMLINSVSGEDPHRALESAASVATAHSAELKAGIEAYKAKKR